MPNITRCYLHLCLVLCLLLIPQPAQAAGVSFYVATNGSDSAGNGSINQPWATIGYALQRVPDGSRILVRPGTYSGQIHLRGNFQQGVTVQAEVAYQARLRHNGQVVVATGNTSGITLEGFDIAHSGPGSSSLVIHLNGSRKVGLLRNITLRNNVMHDSYKSDILKIDASASNVLVEGNIFYNQSGSDEHIDVNSARDIIIRNNIFFNDFAGSGRPNYNDTSSFIVIKDSAGADDQLIGSHNITVAGNVFLNWQGLPSSAFVMIGEDGKPYYEAQVVFVENNLMLGNSPHTMTAPLAVWGAKDILFRNNTISGDLPAKAFAMLLSKAVDNPSNENIQFANNIWSDPTGTMGAQAGGGRNDFSDTKPDKTNLFSIHHNVYWNNGQPIPADSADKVNYTNDPYPVFGNPGLATPGVIVLPRWVEAAGLFGDGSRSIGQAFVSLVNSYGAIPSNSAAAGAADPAFAPVNDILGRARSGASVDAGAYQLPSTVMVSGRSGNGFANLIWQYRGDMPDGTTWRITCASSEGSSEVMNLPPATRTYLFKDLKNYVRYTFTVSAVTSGGEALTSSTTVVMPSDIFVLLPITRK